MTSARDVAYSVLRSVHREDAYSNLILPAAIDQARLSARDAALATELTYGTLRRQGSLDAVINACATRTDDMDEDVRDVLRLGAYQLLFMRIPTHAAVDESVQLTKHHINMSSSKFVNAVLRKISDHTWEEWLATLTSGVAPVDALAIEYSYPVWVIRALAEAYKCDATSIRPILEAGNIPAPVTLVARPTQSTIEELLELPNVQPGHWSPLAGTLTRPSEGEWSGKPGDLELVRQNRVGVQDEGSQLVALALVNATLGVSHSENQQAPERETHWLDMCAGPGGKAALLAGFAAELDLAFTALEPAPARAQLVSNSLRHVDGDCDVITTDARDYQPSYSFDRILVDAPCTGLGALRRRPEARWRKQPSDIPSLTALQTELLNHAASLVRVGGVICYATCSPHLAETDAVVATFLKAHPAFVAEPIAPTVPQLNLPDDSLSMRLRPDVHGTDGMFLALLKRIA